MGSFSIWHWMIVAIIAMLLFGGRGRFSDLMGDVGKGLKNFKKGLSEEEPEQPAPRLQSQANPEPNPSHDLQPMKDDRPQG